MGYQSDVYMCITGPKDQILAEVASLRLQGDHHMLAALDEWAVVAISGNRAALTLGGQGTDWKWYDSFPDVQAHHKIYAHFEALADEENSDLRGAFVRVGEDDDDIESRYFGEDGYDLGAPERSIFRAYDGMGEDLRPRIAETQAQNTAP